MQTELPPNVISGIGMPILAAKSSHEDEDEMGSLVDVIVQSWMAMERDERVVVRTCATGDDLETVSGDSAAAAED